MKISNMDELFDLYRDLIGDLEKCNNNQKLLSALSYTIDAHALAVIINFYNKYPEMNKLWKASLLIIRIYALFTTELIKYFEKEGLFTEQQYNKPNSLEDIYNLRNKIHQFKKNNFNKKVSEIDGAMGRSRDRLNPHIDICLEYLEIENKTIFFGTNVNQFYFSEAKKQEVVNFAQDIIRVIEKSPFGTTEKFEIKRCKEIPKHKWAAYSYTDIVKNTKLDNERVIDRIIFAFDDLCCVSEFFEYVVEVDDYLIEKPYILYFFIKVIAIILDETFDNFNIYIKRMPNDINGRSLKRIISSVDIRDIEYYKKLRNNLHYNFQESITIGGDDELINILRNEIEVVNALLKEIRDILNINPSKGKLLYYRFLRWIQLPGKKDE